MLLLLLCYEEFNCWQIKAVSELFRIKSFAFCEGGAYRMMSLINADVSYGAQVYICDKAEDIYS